MLSKAIPSLLPNYVRLKGGIVFSLLVLISFLIRFPFFFRDYIDRDESTFILVAQSWVEGHLPYTQLWDLKPPVVYFFFASLIYLFGKSFFAIRLAGALAVAITAFFTYLIGLEVTSKKVSFWAAVSCVLLLSLFGSLQGVMSEHVCMLLVMPALYILIKYRGSFAHFAAGLFIGLGLMAKTSMAYSLFFLGIWLLWVAFKDRFKLRALLNALSYGLGIVLAILLTVYPYYLSGQIQVWWNSVILAPMAYSATGSFSILKLLPFYLLIGGFFFLIGKKKLIDFRARNIQILGMIILGLLLSFMQTGKINGHYLIQLHPILIVFVSVAISQVGFLERTKYQAYLFLGLLVLPVEAYAEYGAVIKHKLERGTFYNGEGFSVPSYLQEKAISTHGILFFEYHIGYWLLNQIPPTKASTHPSNICRDETFPFYNSRTTSMEELRFIMEELRPPTIIVRKGKPVFDKEEAVENEYINAYIKAHYKATATVEKAEIYQRL